MVTRLLLGCGSVGHAVLNATDQLPGETVVLDPDPGRVEALRNRRVAAERVDITDATAISGHGADIVIVAGDDAGLNYAATGAAVTAYPTARVLVYAGEHPTPRQREWMTEQADEMLRPGAFILDEIHRYLDPEDGAPGQELQKALRSIEGELAIVTHDNPDPDAIASGVALAAIARRAGVPATVWYHGDISHQENRAFVNLLDLDLNRYETAADIDAETIALVDHSHPGINDQLPPESSIHIVVDHHPSDRSIEATFVDVRTDLGATATILAEYLEQFAVDPDTEVATALLYGIRIDTNEFRRDTSAADFEAAAFLLQFADTEALEQIESPSVSADTFETIAQAVKRRRIEGAALVSCVGPISDRDTLAQAADRLLSMEGIATTLVTGFTDTTIYVSARTTRSDLDLGRALRVAFGDIGSAGGHTDMAGAQLSLGLFDALGDEAQHRLTDIVDDIVTERFFEVLRSDVAILGEDGEDTVEPATDPTDIIERVTDDDATGTEGGGRPDDDPVEGKGSIDEGEEDSTAGMETGPASEE